MLTILMGVSGSGKSTVGQEVAQLLGRAFIEGDDFHPSENIAAMAAGQPLTDEDRGPWIDAIGKAVQQRGEDAVLACSALSSFVRTSLKRYCAVAPFFVHLDGSRDLIARRLSARRGHFFSAELLDSQFDALDIDSTICRVPIDRPVGIIAADVAALVRLHERPD